jgi:hypothetical protein
VVAVNAVVVEVEEALGDLGLPPPRNRDDAEEERTENSFGRRQLQPMSTTGGCRSVKLLLLPLLDDMLAVAVAGWKPLEVECARVCVRAGAGTRASTAHTKREGERAGWLGGRSRGYTTDDELSGTVGGCVLGAWWCGAIY